MDSDFDTQLADLAKRQADLSTQALAQISDFQVSPKYRLQDVLERLLPFIGKLRTLFRSACDLDPGWHRSEEDFLNDCPGNGSDSDLILDLINESVSLYRELSNIETSMSS
jgi:hypothetical protein